MQEAWVQSLGQEDPLEKDMATHSSILAWEIQWTEEAGRIQSMEWQTIGHDCEISNNNHMQDLPYIIQLSLYTSPLK